MGSDVLTEVDVLTVRLEFAEAWGGPPRPHLLRGALGRLFIDEPLMHQHEAGRTLHRYPRVQYRWDGRGPAVVGVGDGVAALRRIEWPGMTLDLGGQQVVIVGASLEHRRHRVGPADRLRRYRFMQPWLPLSQENYKRYRDMPRHEQRAELDRLLVANVLLGLRGFGVEYGGRLLAAFELGRSAMCRYKDVRLLGFEGAMVVNADLPDGFALGRAISHGYGWIAADSA